MTKTLAGKVALVTGASRGIGAAIAEALADQGANVAISYVASTAKADDVVHRLEAKGVRVAAFKADQADRAQVEELVKRVAEHFGRLDILVNNAGVFAGAPVGSPEADIAALDRQYAINLQAVVTAIRTAARVMADGGRIISIGSGLASRASFPGTADYAATKAAIVGYSKGAARDLAPRGITVNVVETGSTDTDMNPDSGDFAAAQKALIALGRFAKPAEIAAGVTLLASPTASYITGTVLTVDGGFAA